ncbi:response regulator [Oxynema aestuarii]|uniref:Response regulator n=1 Tax=Oxynema aestuarii AP17 TaxID=2064643 RepID=A0A6H1TTU4_9CYAN|nr:response regulator [Oxynema aestuarii]QIZ69971.1 response regulator [Oxynema aestuarii AP17]RMH77209.1 MAG: response regulator [Cyanobacteria bacterium J007]
MDNAIPELDNIRSQLKSLERRKKPKMLVVDDEPDNLDLLYRTFRREFQVLKAESGGSALEILSQEGEVAVIISDQRMPEMKGTEFLSKTVPQFPNTVRIILTGFTDIEDLVEAINSGQVYKYITKPWDPNELKAVVQRAAETYELLKQRTEELRRAQAQTNLLMTLVQAAQESQSFDECFEPIARAFGENFSADIAIVQMLEGTEIAGARGIYAREGEAENWLADDPLVKEAIATGSIQVVVNVPADDKLAELAHYQKSDVQAHLIIPIKYREVAIALLSLQWKRPCTLREDELSTLHLCVQQAAIALTCTRYHP